MISREERCGDNDLVGVDPSAAIISTAQSWAHDHLVPLNVSLEITLACNIRCVHCYNFDRDEPWRRGGAGLGTAGSAGLEVAPEAPEGRKAERPAGRTVGHESASCSTVVSPELSRDEILGLITDVRAAGCLFLSLTGGEVLSHPHLFAFLDRARDLNLAVQLLTNGTLLRPGMAKRLASYRNLLGASVSLYGATADIHDEITQVKGSFARTWAGVERLRAAGVSVRLKFIIMSQNAHQAAAMMASASARNFPYMIDMTVTARHDGTDGSLAARIDRQQLEALCRGPLRELLPLGRRPPPPAADFNCNCARGTCAISARGDVYPCISVPWSTGNVRERSFQEIWEDSPVFNRIRGLTLADFPRCAPCPDRAYCSHDRGAAFTASGGDYTGADPFVCATAQIAHALAEEPAGLDPVAPPALHRSDDPPPPRQEQGMASAAHAWQSRGDNVTGPHGTAAARATLARITELKRTLGGREKRFDCAVLRRTGSEVTVLFVAPEAMHVHGVNLPAGTVTFGHFWTDRPYNVYHWLDARSGATLGFYVNLSAKTKVSDHVLEWLDLSVDVLILPDGSVTVLDEDEIPADTNPALRSGISDAKALVLAGVPGLVAELENDRTQLWPTLGI